MRLELTIETSYVREWSVWEGVRELVANGKDAESEFGAPLTVSHRGQTLIIENDGAILPREALLLGHTSKSGRDNTIGTFGEGLKLGILALVRAGRPVKIRSGDEVWMPTIARSEKFNADVLVFDIHSGRKPEKRVRVEVGGVTEVEWAKFRERLLFLHTLAEFPEDQFVKTGYGTLLLGEKHRGKIFVRGVWVADEPTLRNGYDFCSGGVKIDRDRKMVDSFDMKWQTSQIWTEAVRRRPDMLDPMLALVNDDPAGELQYMNALGPDNLERVAAKFRDQFGDQAVPVDNLTDSQELEHLGKRGVIVPKVLKALLAATLGSVNDVKKRLGEEVLEERSWGDLEEKEQAHLLESVTLLNAAQELTGVGPSTPISLDVIQVVTFRSGKFLGMYKDGKFLLSRGVLSDFAQTLATLLHEVAHRRGGDGTHDHVAELERLWVGVVMKLRKKERLGLGQTHDEPCSEDA